MASNQASRTGDNLEFDIRQEMGDVVLTDPTVFLVAHPDDEIPIAGTLRRLLDEGARVHGLWMTAGERDEVRKNMRWAETVQASAILGLQPESIEFLDCPFLRLHHVLDEAADLVATRLRSIRPRQIFTVGFEGGHIDHDAVNFLAYEGLFRSGLEARLFEFPLYNGAGPGWWYRFRLNAFPDDDPPTRYVPITQSALRARHGAMTCYHSQWGFMATFRLLALLRPVPGEPYRPCPASRTHLDPPHRGALNIERWFNRYMNARFEDLRRAVMAARRRP